MVNSMFYYELSNVIKHNQLTIVHLIINIEHNY